MGEIGKLQLEFSRLLLVDGDEEVCKNDVERVSRQRDRRVVEESEKILLVLQFVLLRGGVQQRIESATC